MADACPLPESFGPMWHLVSYIDNEWMEHADIIPGLHVGDDQRVRVASVDVDRVLILDRTFPGSNLWIHNLDTDEVISLAGNGQGPGELMFPTDLIVDENVAYVSMGDRRIASFICDATTCTHERDVRLQFQPTGIGRMEASFSAIGTLPLQGDTGLDELPGAIHIVDETGSYLQSVGVPYSTDRWLVTDMLLRDGGIVSGPGDWHGVYYSILPYIYIYQYDGTLDSIIDIDRSFHQGTVESEPGSISIVRESDHSRILEVNTVGDVYLFVTVRSVMDRVLGEAHHTSNFSFDYYLIGLESSCATHVGREEYTGSVGLGRWFITDQHLLRVQDGSVYMVHDSSQ